MPHSKDCDQHDWDDEPCTCEGDIERRLDADDVEELGEELRSKAAKQHYGYCPEDSFPVMVEVTTTHVIWVAADDQEAAVKAVERDGSWYERIGPESAVDHAMAASSPHRYDWEWRVYSGGHDAPDTTNGPFRRCAACGGEAHSEYGYVHHRLECEERSKSE